jgi:hypothetical protein
MRNAVTKFLVLLLFFCAVARSADIPINPQGPTTQLANLTWGQSGTTGFNNNFWFAPLFLNESLCVYVYNNNATNNHTFSISVSVNGNPNNTTPSDGSWLIMSSTNSIATGISTGSPGGIGLSISGAPLVSVNLSNSNSASGSNDTANVYIVQTTGSCFSGVQTPNILTGGGINGNVQGVIQTGLNGQPIFPLLLGALDPPTNLGFQTNGIDIFSSNTANIGFTNGNITLGFPPKPTSATGEFAFVFYGPIVTTVSTSTNAPWTSLEGNCSSSTTGLCTATLANYKQTDALVQNVVGPSGSTAAMIFIAFSKPPTIANHANSSGASQTLALSIANNGDTILVGFHCNPASGVTCGVTSVTDTFGSVFKTIPAPNVVGNSASGNLPLTAYMATAANSGADTITITQTVSSARGIEAIDLSNVTAAPLNTPSAPLAVSNNKFVSQEDDNGGLFLENGGFDYTLTTTLAISGITLVPLWSQSQHGIFYSCTVALRVTNVSGTTPTLDTFFQDSADNIGFNDRMHFPQSVAINNYIGAVSGGSGGITPVLTTDGVLAAASKIDGPLSAFGRIKFVTGGTTPIFTFTINVACR